MDQPKREALVPVGKSRKIYNSKVGMCPMIYRLDRLQKILCGLLLLVMFCVFIMIINKTPFILATRRGATQAIPLLWISPVVLLGQAVPLGLRNLGGLLAILSAGLIGGGTVFSTICVRENGGGFTVSWMQWLLCIIVVISSVVAVSRMNMDFTDIGIDDLLN